jgi:hypothetical protein
VWKCTDDDAVRSLLNALRAGNSDIIALVATNGGESGVEFTSIRKVLL